MIFKMTFHQVCINKLIYLNWVYLIIFLNRILNSTILKKKLLEIINIVDINNAEN